MKSYITLVRFNNHHTNNVLQVGSIVKLVKEPENLYDSEAIRFEMRHIGKVGYVANSTSTVARGTMSAGRLYDKITEDLDFAQIMFVTGDAIIAKVLDSEEIDEIKKDKNSDIHYLIKNSSLNESIDAD